VRLLPSDGFRAPERFRISFSDQTRGVAATGGRDIRCAGEWFRRNLAGEAKGAVVHELVHVVQQYGQARRRNPEARRAPGWLVEGIPDYIRWYLYEPESRGAEIRPGAVAQARYDLSYRVSANFLNWVAAGHDAEGKKAIIEKLTAALRAGAYEDGLWKSLTGQTLEELGAAWKTSLERAPGAGASSP
jgi:hypothetical protein